VPVLAAVLIGCSGETIPPPPAAGLILLGLGDGAYRGQLALGSDPVAVTISADGRTAYVSDNGPGIVYAVAVPELKVRWKTVVGGRPGPLLAGLDFVFVSLYETGQVAELDARSGTVLSQRRVGPRPGQLVLDDGRIQVACGDGRVWDLEGASRPGGRGFGLAAASGQLWSADYDAGALVRVGDGHRVALPAGLHPFWLSAGPDDRILIAAEGADEDRDPGAALLMDRALNVTSLAVARDPDLVLEWDQRVYIAAHAERRVTVLGKAPGRVSHWMPGAAVVALAVDPGRGILVAVTNAGE
jgi:hypothetical protein